MPRAVWLFFAGCIVAIPVAGARGHYLWAAGLTRLVLSSGASWRRIEARVFGVLFVIGGLFVLGRRMSADSRGDR